MIRALAEELQQKDQRLERLENRIRMLLRRYYGPRAERFDPNQELLLPKEELTPAEESDAPEDEPAEERARPRKRRRRRRSSWADLPRKRMEHPVASDHRVCSECGTEKVKIGEDVTEEIDYEPASIHVIEHVKPKYACKKCENGVTTAETPPRPIEKGIPGPGLLAHVAVSKYQDHLPLYRQERIFDRQGLRIARSTLCDWVAATAGILEPIYKAMVEDVLASRILHTDDTPVPVLDRRLDRTRTARLWVYVGDKERRRAGRLPRRLRRLPPGRCVRRLRRYLRRRRRGRGCLLGARAEEVLRRAEHRHRTRARCAGVDRPALQDRARG
jgi:transposase